MGRCRPRRRPPFAQPAWRVRWRVIEGPDVKTSGPAGPPNDPRIIRLCSGCWLKARLSAITPTRSAPAPSPWRTAAGHRSKSRRPSPVGPVVSRVAQPSRCDFPHCEWCGPRHAIHVEYAAPMERPSGDRLILLTACFSRGIDEQSMPFARDDFDRAARAADDQIPAVGGEAHSERRHQLVAHRGLLLTSRHVPEMHVRVEPGACQQRPVRRKCQTRMLPNSWPKVRSNFPDKSPGGSVPSRRRERRPSALTASTDCLTPASIRRMPLPSRWREPRSLHLQRDDNLVGRGKERRDRPLGKSQFLEQLAVRQRPDCDPFLAHSGGDPVAAR